MIEWFKNRTPQEKWMLALIAVLIIGVVVRWGFIREEAWDAFKSRIEHFQAPGKKEPASVPDSLVGWDRDIVRDTMEL